MAVFLHIDNKNIWEKKNYQWLGENKGYCITMIFWHYIYQTYDLEKLKKIHYFSGIIMIP